MSTISPMTPRPQPAGPGEQPVVSLQERLADRLAQTPPDVQAGGRRKKERAGEEALALHAAVAHTVRDHAQDPAALRISGAASTAQPVRDHAQDGAELRRGDSAPVPHTDDHVQDTAALRRGDAAATADTVRDHAGDSAASQRAGAAAMTSERRPPDASPRISQEAGAFRAPAGVERQVTTIGAQVIEPQSPGPVAVDEAVAHVEASPSTRADTAELPTAGPVPPVRSEAAATTTTTAPAETAQLAPRWASATPAPVAAAPTPSGKEGSSVTVAFQSWGPGHEVRAQWLPGGGVLMPGSERVGQALSAAASQPGAAIAGEGWRVERTDPDAEQRERPRGDAEQDA